MRQTTQGGGGVECGGSIVVYCLKFGVSTRPIIGEVVLVRAVSEQLGLIAPSFSLRILNTALEEGEINEKLVDFRTITIILRSYSGHLSQKLKNGW